MDRRRFLRQTVLFSAGALLVPTVLSSCRKEELFDGETYSGKVIVIGAGSAGLYAGHILKSKGIDFTILEASAIHGGRLGKLIGFSDSPIDLGAQWLHGKNSIAGNLVTSSGTAITLDDSEMQYWFQNQLVATLPTDVEALFTDEDAPDVSFENFASQSGLGTEYKYIVEGFAGDFGADASRISVAETVREEENWCSGDDDFKFRETYYDLIHTNIAAGIMSNIIFNTPVTKIDYSSETIVVTDANNNTHTADKIIIAVPITILKANTITFVPALPSEKTDAFQKIGMDAGMKVFLKFSSKFYNQNIVGGTICAAYADESVGKSGTDNVLLAFIMGEQAEYLTALGSDQAIVNALLGELDLVFNGQATASYLDAHVQNFTTLPYIRGAYSYSTVGIGDARTIAAQAVDDKLFFAGEAMNINGHHQTVQGALETGYREVINILDSVRK